MKLNSKNLIIKDKEKIKEYILEKSETMFQKINQNDNYDYLMIVKKIFHSDIVSSGKRKGLGEGLEKNYLYYLTTKEMEEIEKTTGKNFESAKQSNIYVPKEFYEFLEIEKLERRHGKQIKEHNHIKLNESLNVFLVKDTLKYFDIEYTKKVFEKLKKFPLTWHWSNYKNNFPNKDFIEIELSCAIHGLGIQENIEFHKLRRNIFKNDTIIFLMRKNEKQKDLYILLEKNPKFFTIIGEKNESWENYINIINKKELYNLTIENNVDKDFDEKTRTKQNKWRNLLAEEMMNYTTNDNEIFCPLTYITINYETIGTLFRASHIKGYSECDVDEVYDINNGILMIANADALFDKHLITIKEDGTIIFSYLLENDYKLKQELRLTEKVFKPILNEKRIKYLKYHNNIFLEKEEKRKTIL